MGSVALPVALVGELVAVAAGRGCVARDFGVAAVEFVDVAGVAGGSGAGSRLDDVVGASALAAG